MTESSGRLVQGGESIAWRRRAGRGPTIVWCGGARSTMTASKASALDDWAIANGRALLRFDYFGHGESTGLFENGAIGRWRADALAAIDALTTGPVVIVGSSLGGWIATLGALARPARTAGLVLVAPAVDYTVALVEAAMTDAERATLARTGAFVDPRGQTYTRAFLDDARRWSVLARPLPVRAPVRILHGGGDEIVPWRHGLQIAEAFDHADVVFTLIRDGDHRLARRADLTRLIRAIEELAGP